MGSIALIIFTGIAALIALFTLVIEIINLYEDCRIFSLALLYHICLALAVGYVFIAVIQQYG